MNKIRKTTVLLLTLTLVIALTLVGCATDKTDTTPTTTTAAAESTTAAATDAAAETEEPTLEPVTLRWILPQVVAHSESEPVFEAASKIFEEKINATVEFDLFEFGQFDDKIKLMLGAGEEADIFFTSNWANNYYQNIAKDGLTDITDMLDTVAPILKAKFANGIWDAVRVGGRIYAVPNQCSWVRELAFLFRQDLVEKYNFDYNSVHTFEDLEPYLQTIKENEPDYYALEINENLFGNAQNYFGWDAFAGVADLPGVGMNYDESLTVLNQFETQAFQDYIEMINDWNNKGYAPPAGGTTGINYRQMGLYAVVSNGVSYPGAEAIYTRGEADGTPYVLAGNVNGDSAISTSSVTSNMNGIPITSANPERALMALEVVNTDKEVYNTIVWGIEGTNYTKLADGSIEQIDNGKYTGTYYFFIGDQFLSYTASGEPLDMLEQIGKLNTEAKPSLFSGFVFNPVPVESQIAQCTSIVDEYIGYLLSGTADIDTVYPEFINALKAAGSDEIIAEMQSQVNAWAGK